MKPWCLLLLILLALASGLVLFGYREATADPIVRLARVDVPGLDQPLRLLFISDIHAQGPDMPPGRLAEILRRLDRLHPDLLLLGGDYTGNKPFGSTVSVADALAPFKSVHPRLGIAAIFGNHDAGDTAALKTSFAAIGVTTLEDQAQQFGPVAIGGIWRRTRKTSRELLALAGPKIILSHRPDPVASLTPGVDLMLAGHTHCGQIVLPIVGALFTGTKLPRPFTCGATKFRGVRLMVSAGIGTSHVPLRLGAPPDVWLVILRPALHQATGKVYLKRQLGSATMRVSG